MWSFKSYNAGSSRFPTDVLRADHEVESHLPVCRLVTHCPSMVGSGVATGVFGILHLVRLFLSFSRPQILDNLPFLLHTKPGAEKHLAIVWGWQ